MEQRWGYVAYTTNTDILSYGRLDNGFNYSQMTQRKTWSKLLQTFYIRTAIQYETGTYAMIYRSEF